MQGTVITIVAGAAGGLTAAVEQAATGTVRGVGGSICRVNTLSKGKAVDIHIGESHGELTRLLRERLANFAGFDIFMQPDDDFRKKKILLADMDATIVEGETLDDLAEHLGIKDKIAPITAQAMRGEIDFPEALRRRVGLLKGLPEEALFATAGKMRFSKGARELVAAMNRAGARCVLVSGGFEQFTQRVALQAGFWKSFGNRLEISEGKLTGEVIPPILDRHRKEQILRETSRMLNIDPRFVMAVGDGANDIPMLQAAGAGVGYFAKPAVQAATPHQVRHTDLTSLLYMQGYAVEETTASIGRIVPGTLLP